MIRKRSHEAFTAARARFVGGVNSPVRAFGGVGGEPVFANSGSGAGFEDLDGNRYLDYVLSWGPLIMGHAHQVVTRAATAAVKNGTSFGMPSAIENRLADGIRVFFPELERMRLVNSGTEATMSALRLARGYTGRDGIVKFAGCYHGHSDSLLVAAGSGLATFGTPSSPGVTAGTSQDTIVLPFNDVEALREAFSRHGDRLAAVILEIVPCNMGLIFPDPDFLDVLQSLCQSYNTLLIADEVLTGLRVARGGAYHRYGVQPDLVALGKVVGGGFPLAAYGGRREIMSHLAPEGPVYQAGTLSGNPVAAAVGAAVLEWLAIEDPFAELERKMADLVSRIAGVAESRGVKVQCQSAGSLGGIAFRNGPARNFADMQAADHDAYSRFFHEMLDRGIYLAPSGYEVLFLSTEHTSEDLERTVTAADEAFVAITD